MGESFVRTSAESVIGLSSEAPLQLTDIEKIRATKTFREACSKARTEELDMKAFSVCMMELMEEAREKAVAKGDQPPSMPSKADLEAAFETADTDRGGTVDHGEFLELYAKVKAGRVSGIGGFFSSLAFSLFSPPIGVGGGGSLEGQNPRTLFFAAEGVNDTKEKPPSLSNIANVPHAAPERKHAALVTDL